MPSPEQIQKAVRDSVPAAFVLTDAAYGEHYDFRDGVTELRLTTRCRRFGTMQSSANLEKWPSGDRLLLGFLCLATGLYRESAPTAGLATSFTTHRILKHL